MMPSIWKTGQWSEPASESWRESASLVALDARIREQMGWIHSVVLVSNGGLIFEGYYGGADADIRWDRKPAEKGLLRGESYETGKPALPQNVKSVTKSVMSALVGIAIDRGHIASADATLGDVLEGYFRAGADRRKAKITVRNLLMQRSGLFWQENTGITWDWINSGDLVRFSLFEQPVSGPPRSTWGESTGKSHIPFACIAPARGGSTFDFWDEHLFRPLGFQRHWWTAEPSGMTIGGDALHLTPRDMAKFGLLFLMKGTWGAESLVPAEWVDLSTAAQADVTQTAIRDDWQLGPWPASVRFYKEGYGYQWWRTTLASHEAYFALGYGGQLIAVLDELRLVAVVTSDTTIPPSEVTPLREVAPLALIEEWIEATYR